MHNLSKENVFLTIVAENIEINIIKIFVLDKASFNLLLWLVGVSCMDFLPTQSQV